ncbi:hypothetical protein BV898_08714 [Hypsibius exemplaris]|uniref:Uncharacterized protein n=1 Tax=Hypsibius exemplaris TaxID=2072580 RepID=A0A1W0WPR1_HYPEX|nr:hypothetical protein BV898_08714 [Hypsibius exemplaris]
MGTTVPTDGNHCSCKWEPLILRRLKQSLVLSYKLIFSKIPLGELTFKPFILITATSAVTGHTRRIGKIMDHPKTVQLHCGALDENGTPLAVSHRSFALTIGPSDRDCQTIGLRPSNYDRQTATVRPRPSDRDRRASTVGLPDRDYRTATVGPSDHRTFGPRPSNRRASTVGLPDRDYRTFGPRPSDHRTATFGPRPSNLRTATVGPRIVRQSQPNQSFRFCGVLFGIGKSQIAAVVASCGL